MAPEQMMMSKVAAGGRMGSMEWEPKTLTLDQLKYAREAALYVVSTKTAEEAIRIFTEGLKPVMGIRKTSVISAADSFSSDDDLDIDSFEYSGAKACRGGSHGHGKCSIKRDVLTAPF